MNYFQNTDPSTAILAVIIGLALSLLIWSGMAWVLLTVGHMIYPALSVPITFWNCFLVGLSGIVIRSIFK